MLKSPFFGVENEIIAAGVLFDAADGVVFSVAANKHILGNTVDIANFQSGQD
jgi:hypothetical protein